MIKVVKPFAAITLSKASLTQRFESDADISNESDVRNCSFNIELLLKGKEDQYWNFPLRFK